jgi:hypothetical protein
MAKKSTKLEGYDDTVSVLETMKEGRYMPKWVEQNNIITNTEGEVKDAIRNRDIPDTRKTTQEQKEKQPKKSLRQNKVSPKTKNSKETKEKIK